jgi:hypothetical protein
MYIASGVFAKQLCVARNFEMKTKTRALKEEQVHFSLGLGANIYR